MEKKQTKPSVTMSMMNFGAGGEVRVSMNRICMYQFSTSCDVGCKKKLVDIVVSLCEETFILSRSHSNSFILL